MAERLLLPAELLFRRVFVYTGAVSTEASVVTAQQLPSSLRFSSPSPRNNFEVNAPPISRSHVRIFQLKNAPPLKFPDTCSRDLFPNAKDLRLAKGRGKALFSFPSG